MLLDAEAMKQHLKDHPNCSVCERIYKPSIDHIIPQSKGGTDEESNIRTLCKSCNSSKRDLDNEFWEKYYAPWPNRIKIGDALKGLMRG